MRYLEGRAMYTNNVTAQDSTAGKWERIMDNRIFGLRIGLCLMLALLPSTGVFADTEITAASYGSGSGGDVEIMLTTTGDTPRVSVFATENPARIVLDLADTNSSVDSAPVSVGMGAVQSFTTIGAGGRTRLLVDLSRSVAYDYSADAGRIVLTIAAGSAAASMASTGSSSGDYAVQNVDFRRGENGQSRIIVSLDGEGANVAVNASPGQLGVDIFNTDLPDRLNQQLDVVDFATPVQLIDVSRHGDGIELNMAVSGLFEHLAYQTGNDVIIEVSEVVQIATETINDVVFYDEKTYTGTRVTFNFQDIPVRSVLQLIADVSDLNIVVSDDVAGNLTLRLTNVPWDQALDIVLDARNLDKRANGNVIWIAPTAVIAAREQELLQAAQDRKELEPLQTALISVSYATALSLQTLIEQSSDVSMGEMGLLSERGSVTVD